MAKGTYTYNYPRPAVTTDCVVFGKDGALRELKEETGLDLKNIKQIGAFSDVHRDPRSRVITIAYYAVTEINDVCGSDDAAKAQWFSLNNIPPLAFDHDKILREAIQKMHEEFQE